MTLVALALLIGGAAAFYSWTQTQYFVGKDGSEVAIFRGVNAQFGPIKFFEVQENTDLKLADLTAAARSQVDVRHHRERSREGPADQVQPARPAPATVSLG